MTKCVCKGNWRLLKGEELQQWVGDTACSRRVAYLFVGLAEDKDPCYKISYQGIEQHIVCSGSPESWGFKKVEE